jgi:hypothetical protein
MTLKKEEEIWQEGRRVFMEVDRDVGKNNQVADIWR